MKALTSGAIKYILLNTYLQSSVKRCKTSLKQCCSTPFTSINVLTLTQYSRSTMTQQFRLTLNQASDLDMTLVHCVFQRDWRSSDQVKHMGHSRSRKVPLDGESWECVRFALIWGVKINMFDEANRKNDAQGWKMYWQISFQISTFPSNRNVGSK